MKQAVKVGLSKDSINEAIKASDVELFFSALNAVQMYDIINDMSTISCVNAIIRRCPEKKDKEVDDLPGLISKLSDRYDAVDFEGVRDHMPPDTIYLLQPFMLIGDAIHVMTSRVEQEKTNPGSADKFVRDMREYVETIRFAVGETKNYKNSNMLDTGLRRLALKSKQQGKLEERENWEIIGAMDNYRGRLLHPNDGLLRIIEVVSGIPQSDYDRSVVGESPWRGFSRQKGKFVQNLVKAYNQFVGYVIENNFRISEKDREFESFRIIASFKVGQLLREYRQNR